MNIAGTPIQQRYIMETITMTTVTERRTVREVEESVKTSGEVSPAPSPCSSPALPTGSPISGILKGGKLWKQQSQDVTNIQVQPKPNDNVQVS